MRMRKLKVLELFSGTRSIGKAFESSGHDVYSVDWNADFEASWHTDIGGIRAKDVIARFGHPDIVWASPDCTTFSVAAISKHRKLDEVLGGGIAISPYAQKCDQTDLNVIRLLRDLRPTLYFIENPRGMLRKMPWMQWSPMYTVTYCQYLTKLPIEQRRMKPTDIWTNHPNPNFLPPCKNGDPCHVRAPRGSVTGTQGLKLVDKYRIPEDLCAHIVSISEDYIKRVDMANGWLSAYGFEPITPQWDDGPYEPIQLSMDITG